MVVEWDNSYSRLRSKMLTYQVALVDEAQFERAMLAQAEELEQEQEQEQEQKQEQSQQGQGGEVD